MAHITYFFSSKKRSTSLPAGKEVMTIAAIIKNEDKDSMHVVTRFILWAAIVIAGARDLMKF